jgi:hypothetical protein
VHEALLAGSPSNSDIAKEKKKELMDLKKVNGKLKSKCLLLEASLDSMKVKLEKKHNKSKASLTKSIGAHSSSKLTHTSALSAIREKLELSTFKEQSLEAKLEQKKLDYDQLHVSHNTLSAKLSLAEINVSTNEQNGRYLKIAQESAANVAAELHDAKTKITTLQQKLDDATQNYVNLQTAHGTKIAEINVAQEAALSAERTQSDAKMQDLQTERKSALQEEKVNSESKLQIQQTKFESKMAEVEAIMDKKLQQQLRKHKTELETKDAMIKKLGTKLESKRKSLESQQKEAQAALDKVKNDSSVVLTAATKDRDDRHVLAIKELDARHEIQVKLLRDTIAKKKRKYTEQRQKTEETATEIRRTEQMQNLLRSNQSEKSARQNDQSDLEKMLRNIVVSPRSTLSRNQWSQQDQWSGGNPGPYQPSRYSQQSDNWPPQNQWPEGNSGRNQPSPKDTRQLAEGKPTRSSIKSWSEEMVLQKLRDRSLESFQPALKKLGMHVGCGLVEVKSFEDLEPTRITNEKGEPASTIQLKTLYSAIAEWQADN